MWIYVAYATLFVVSTPILLLVGFNIVDPAWRQKAREKSMKQNGYYIHWRPDGPESGTLFYEESDTFLEFGFDFYRGEEWRPIIFVPSDGQWKQVMPDWVKERKTKLY